MKKIDLKQTTNISAGMADLLQAHACQVVLNTWAENYMTCRWINRMLNNLVHFGMFDANAVEHLQNKLPAHLQTCSSFESYLLANPGYQTFCD